ncbi:MAG: hypothetical protein AAB855_02125 [Patescibacteria group bacterium]
MAGEPQPEASAQSKYKEVLFGALQSELEYYEERNRFALLVQDGTQGTVPFHLGEEMYDTRKVLMSMEARYAGGRQISHEDYKTILTLADAILRQENSEGFIPFAIRVRESSDILALTHHPRWYLQDLLLQRFINEEELESHKDLGVPSELLQDVTGVVDFCLKTHKWNTQYYHKYPSVGVLFSEDASKKKKFRAGEQANYLSWWRGMPFEISALLLECGIFDMIDDSSRGAFLARLAEMSAEELFDESYFGYPARPPHIPRYMEYLPRTGPAEQLLRMITGVYAGEPEIVKLKERLLANEYQQYSPAQLARLRQILSGEEDELV